MFGPYNFHIMLLPSPSPPSFLFAAVIWLLFLIAVALMLPREHPWGLCSGCLGAGSPAGAITSQAGAFPFGHHLAFIGKSFLFLSCCPGDQEILCKSL